MSLCQLHALQYGIVCSQLSNYFTTRWAITYAGDATFDAAFIRGTIVAGEIYIDNLNYW